MFKNHRPPAAVLFGLAVLLCAAAPASDALVGVWLKDGAPFAELRADGRGRVDHDEVAWKADGRTLRLTYADGEAEAMSYTLRKDALTVVMDGEARTYTRAAAKATGKAKTSAVKAPSGKDKLTELLLSSPWCHFRYNKSADTTRQERVVFRRDGTWDSGSRGEIYSSGAAGTAHVQSDAASGGRWSVKGSVLLLSQGGGPLEDAALSVSRNSNGYPILNAGGKEYSSCR